MAVTGDTTANTPLTPADLSRLGVDRLHGVGPRKLDGLRSLGIHHLQDLLTHYPRRYVDRTKEARIADMDPGEEALVIARCRSITSRRTRNGKAMVLAEFSDGTATLKVSFFNQAWRERQLPPGTEAALFGRLEVFRGGRQMTNPVVDLLGDRTGRIVPIYPLSEKAGISTWELGDWVAQSLRRAATRGFAEPVPAEVLDRLDLLDRGRALAGIHHPESMAEAMAARKRLVFDELLRVQLSLVRRKRRLERDTVGIVHAVADGTGPAPGLVDRFVAGLPFPLTGAQQRAIGEILEDLARPAPMHRLLQGDVGAGKTLVAVAALLTAVQGGHQGALMAPTEVLAEQHHAGIRRLLEGFTLSDGGSTLLGERPLTVALLTNRTTAAERRRLLAGMADGTVDLVVGTHALIQEGVDFRSLGVVVVDEQHRFGVEQRAALRSANPDGTVPDVLVMTATPIPRTAAMTVYGDLDVSVLDELPPGRTPIVTSWCRDEAEEATAWAAVREEVAAGRRAYVVCPLIEESEKLEVASAEETFERLGHVELADLRLGLLHGRMKSDEKDAVMGAFRRGELDVLIATTVIEVGVDVPEATVMVILDADRFGIAQLHQLRGRVGRGKDASRCFLVARGDTADAEARLEAMVRTTDGFELAEVDLDLRGEGTLLGERQTGRNDLKLASLRRDREVVERAREVALELVGDGDGLTRWPLLEAEVDALEDEVDAEYLLKS